ncbi:glycosyltransferase family 87 protein [Amycolatopsis thermophila]|uniref:Alpha-1,2-mannosyltransferase n=1 Tax=Amycolatopsis thermophila TaxID=206084 RepID=A0ABU0F4C9_9PSEU|nr:glycosyltransferase family 87 protein [Amycolatopsis thermophila]MDQ0382391.1 alpha-1,2-mannosyltransferase [Amycolatopsis thermophila]
MRHGSAAERVRLGLELLLALGLFAALAYYAHGIRKWPTDVDVYRLGADTFLKGHSIYSELPVSAIGGALPYTYPPFSAVLFTPLAIIPPPIGYPLLTAATCLALFPIVLAYRKASPELRGLLAKPWMVVAGACVMVVAHPVSNTIFWGQINVLLMMLVAVDVLWPNPRWPRGALIGIAAAVKLTPAGFVLIFLLRKDFRAVVTSFVSFLVMSAIAFVLMPGDSWTYWTDRVFHATGMNIGPIHANESVTATFEKLHLTGTTLTVAGGLGVIAVVVMTFLGTARALRDDNLALALGVNTAGVLLISPISWSHHWVLALPTAALVLVMGVRKNNKWLIVSGWAAVVILWLAPHYWVPLEWQHWSFAQQVAGSSYQIVAVVFLVVMAARWFRGRGKPAPADALDFELANELTGPAMAAVERAGGGVRTPARAGDEA